MDFGQDVALKLLDYNTEHVTDNFLNTRTNLDDFDEYANIKKSGTIVTPNGHDNLGRVFEDFQNIRTNPDDADVVSKNPNIHKPGNSVMPSDNIGHAIGDFQNIKMDKNDADVGKDKKIHIPGTSVMPNDNIGHPIEDFQSIRRNLNDANVTSSINPDTQILGTSVKPDFHGYKGNVFADFQNIRTNGKDLDFDKDLNLHICNCWTNLISDKNIGHVFEDLGADLDDADVGKDLKIHIPGTSDMPIDNIGHSFEHVEDFLKIRADPDDTDVGKESKIHMLGTNEKLDDNIGHAFGDFQNIKMDKNEEDVGKDKKIHIPVTSVIPNDNTRHAFRDFQNIAMDKVDADAGKGPKIHKPGTSVMPIDNIGHAFRDFQNTKMDKNYDDVGKDPKIRIPKTVDLDDNSRLVVENTKQPIPKPMKRDGEYLKKWMYTIKGFKLRTNLSFLLMVLLTVLINRNMAEGVKLNATVTSSGSDIMLKIYFPETCMGNDKWIRGKEIIVFGHYLNRSYIYSNGTNWSMLRIKKFTENDFNEPFNFSRGADSTCMISVNLLEYPILKNDTSEHFETTCENDTIHLLLATVVKHGSENPQFKLLIGENEVTELLTRNSSRIGICYESSLQFHCSLNSSDPVDLTLLMNSHPVINKRLKKVLCVPKHPPEDNNNSHVIGIIVGVIFGLAVVLFFLYLLKRKTFPCLAGRGNQQDAEGASQQMIQLEQK